MPLFLSGAISTKLPPRSDLVLLTWVSDGSRGSEGGKLHTQSTFARNDSTLGSELVPKDSIVVRREFRGGGGIEVEYGRWDFFDKS
jgi:hypothetical protein